MSQQKAAVVTGLELSILKLGSPRRRFASAQFSFDYEAGYLNSSNPGTPPATAPVSPLARSMDEDYEMVFEQHQAAIPFIWEEKPGTPRGASARITSPKEEGTSGSEDEESDALTRSNPSSRTSSTRETDESPATSDFEFASSETIDTKPNHSKSADELFAKGQILPLKPPPRLQSIKQLIAAEAAEDAMGYHSPNRTPGHSFRKDGLRTPARSFRKDALKAFINSPRRDKPGEQVTTMLGFEEWPKDENRKDGLGHRRTSSLSKLPALFRKKSGLGKENMDDFENDENFIGEVSWRKSGLGGENRRPLDCVSSRIMDGCYGKDDIFGSSRNTVDMDARSDYFNTSGRTIPEEEPDREKDEEDQQVQAPDTPKKKQGKLSRFFTKQPSRLSAVAPSPQSSDDVKLKRVEHSSPLLKMCLSNCIGQALVRGVKHFRSLDSQQRRAISAAR